MSRRRCSMAFNNSRGRLLRTSARVSSSCTGGDRMNVCVRMKTRSSSCCSSMMYQFCFSSVPENRKDRRPSLWGLLPAEPLCLCILFCSISGELLRVFYCSTPNSVCMCLSLPLLSVLGSCRTPFLARIQNARFQHL